MEDQKKKSEDMERTYAQEEDEGSYEFVQLHNHDDDTQDIAYDQDPISLH